MVNSLTKSGKKTTFGKYGKLSVKGSSMVSQDGSKCQLRGISTHNLSCFPEYVTPEMMDFLVQDWKIDIFRLALYTADADECPGYCTGSDEHRAELEQMLDDCIQEACKLGIYLIIDWHILFDYDPNMQGEEAVKFFDVISARYKDYPNVIYEICNEPNGGIKWQAIKSYALQVIPVIRKNTSDAIIIVGTPTWSQDVDLAAKDRIEGYENLMYTVHFYADTHKQALRDKLVKGMEEGLAVFVTEFGICNASGDGDINYEEANQWIQLMDQQKVSYILWNLSNKKETSSVILSECNKTTGFTTQDLTPCGKWFVEMMNEKQV